MNMKRCSLAVLVFLVTALPGFADRYGTAANATAQAARVGRPVVARREFGAPGPILDTK